VTGAQLETMLLLPIVKQVQVSGDTNEHKTQPVELARHVVDLI